MTKDDLRHILRNVYSDRRHHEGKYYFLTVICSFSSSLYRSKKDTKVLIEDTDDEAFS
jgi:hypothetical protein